MSLPAISGAGSNLSKYAICMIDYSFREDGTAVVYEVQEFLSSDPSEMGKFGFKKQFEARRRILEQLRVDERYCEYDMSFDKDRQRNILASAGCQSLQPRFLVLNPPDLTDEDSSALMHKQISEFLKTSSASRFVMKGARGARGEQNVFISREMLERICIEGNLGMMSFNCHDVLAIPYALIGSEVPMIKVPLQRIADRVVLEEFINDRNTAGRSETYRACVAFNPEIPDDLRALNTCVYVSGGKANSHDYSKNGQRIDLVDGATYGYSDGKLSTISHEQSGELDCYREVSPVAQESFLKLMRAFSPHFTAKKPITRDFSEKAKDKFNYTDYLHSISDLCTKFPKGQEVVSDFIALQNSIDRYHPNSYFENLTESQENKIKKDCAALLHVILAHMVKFPEWSSHFDGRKNYYLKKSLALLLGYDKDKIAKKDFLMKAINEEEVMEFLSKNPAPEDVVFYGVRVQRPSSTAPNMEVRSSEAVGISAKYTPEKPKDKSGASCAIL